MPDLTLLVEMADYYDVDLRELLDGERKSERMEKELKETVLMVADFTNEQKRKLLRMMQWLFIAGCVSFILHIIVDSYRPDVSDFIYGLLKGATLGIPVAIVSMGVVWTGKYLKLFRKRSK